MRLKRSGYWSGSAPPDVLRSVMLFRFRETCSVATAYCVNWNGPDQDRARGGNLPVGPRPARQPWPLAEPTPATPGQWESAITHRATPWQNGYVERLIGSTCGEALDHLIVFEEAQLRRVLKNYAV